MTGDAKAPCDGAARLGFGLCFGWGLSSFAVSVANNTFNTVLLRYLTDVVGLSALVAGSAVALSRILDAVLFPAVGAASDRSWTRWGRRRLYVLAGGVLGALSVLAIFDVGHLAGLAAARTVLTIALVAYGLAYAFVMVPTVGMAVEMTDDDRDRVRLMSVRVYMLGAGQLIGSSLAPVLLAAWGGRSGAYQGLGAVVAAITAAGCAASFVMTRGARTVRVVAPVALPVGRRLRTILSNRPFVALMVVKLSFWTTVAVSNGLSAYYTRYVLGVSDGWLGLYNLMKMVGWLGFQEAWVRLGRHRSKRFGFCLGAAILSATYASWFLGSGASLHPLIVARGLLIGIGTGGIALNAQAMLPDTIEHDRHRSGLRREGLFSGLYGLVEMSAFSLGILLLGVLLQAGGYVSAGGSGAPQPSGAIHAIALSYCLVPIIGSAVSVAALLLFYDLSPARMAAIARSAPATA